MLRTAPGSRAGFLHIMCGRGFAPRICSCGRCLFCQPGFSKLSECTEAAGFIKHRKSCVYLFRHRTFSAYIRLCSARETPTHARLDLNQENPIQVISMASKVMLPAVRIDSRLFRDATGLPRKIPKRKNQILLIAADRIRTDHLRSGLPFGCLRLHRSAI